MAQPGDNEPSAGPPHSPAAPAPERASPPTGPVEPPGPPAPDSLPGYPPPPPPPPPPVPVPTYPPPTAPPPPSWPGGAPGQWPSDASPAGGGEPGGPPPGYGPPGYPPPGYPPPGYPPPGYGPPGYPPPGYPPPGHGPPGHEPPGGPAGEGPFLDRPGAPPSDRRVAGLWFLFALIGFVVGQLCGTVFVLVAAAADGQLHRLSSITASSAPPAWYIGASLVGLWIGFFLAPVVASKARGTGRLIADFGIRFRLVDLVGIVIGVGGQFLIAALYAPFHVKNLTAPAEKLTSGAHGWSFFVIALLTVVGAPFFEELFFRGLLLRSLARLFTPASPSRSAARAIGVVLAVVVDGLLFAAVHAEPAQFAGLALFGMVLAVIAYRTGRLGMNMVSHASFNLVAVLALLSSRGGIILH